MSKNDNADTMANYFNINYEFDKSQIHDRISECMRFHKTGYICVADGVVLNIANRQPEYLKVINGGMFSICDSGYVPLYLKWIYGVRYDQYCGAQIFMDIVSSRKYRMMFMGTSQRTLDGLRKTIREWNPDVEDMTFWELPYLGVDEFDYEEIAQRVEASGADIIWVALGAPKQEVFMSKLKPHLKRGVMIAVGAAFKFYSGVGEKRAPQWMIKHHLEFVHRIFKEPKKQLKRCGMIILTLPKLLIEETIRKYKYRKANEVVQK